MASSKERGEIKTTSYQKLKNKITELQREKLELKQDIYIILRGDEMRAGMVKARYGMEFTAEDLMMFGEYRSASNTTQGLIGLIRKI